MSGAGAPIRIAVLHGVNLDQLGRRDPSAYGSLTLPELEGQIAQDARSLGLAVSFFQSNHEGAFVEHLHSLRAGASASANAGADAIVVNPGAWTHYSWAIRDALEIAALPALEIHLSNVDEREEWRKLSVIADLCFARIAGRGPAGYTEALETVRDHLCKGST